ncbi:hypothetical protein GO001_33150 [Streptomyces sp. NRRL B-1677]|uniref:hypothetical protein n=1 Tax=Streptomyces sp. NRRL B-1677 TaxID=2682966 RepID=UPI001892B345|nr:hypothetical protein [Streptomyces sp. NRRL B-1677]MBF6049976.1 hypothetical protein [Streptomyces sp. NRRL B-1677]
MQVSEGSALFLALVFGGITVLLVRSRDVRWWQALLIAIFGIYIGQTPVIFTVNSLLTWFLSGFTHT